MVDYLVRHDLPANAGADILSEPFVSRYQSTERSMVIIQFEAQDTGVLSYTRTDGAYTATSKLNGGEALVADCAYMFTIMLSEEEINLQYSADTTVSYLQIREMV